MPSTLRERVEGYVGTISDDNLFRAWLNEACMTIAHLIPAVELKVFAYNANFNDPVSMRNRIVFSFSREGKECILVPHEHSSKVTDVTSFFYATNSCPVVVESEGTATIYPASGTRSMLFWEPPEVTGDEEALPQFPTKYTGLVILDTAIRVKGNQINELRATAWPTVPPLTDLTAQYTKLTQYLDTEQDLELAAGKVQHIQTLLAEQRIKLDAYMSEVQGVVHKLEVEKMALESLKVLYNQEMTLLLGGKGEKNVPA